MLKKIILGLIAGMISGFFSSGGGLILVPTFIYLLHMEPKNARATSIFCMLPMVIVTAFFYNHSNFIDWNIGIRCAIGGIIRGTYRGKIAK